MAKMLTKHLMSSPKVKMDDGTEEEHKVVKGDAAAVKEPGAVDPEQVGARG